MQQTLRELVTPEEMDRVLDLINQGHLSLSAKQQEFLDGVISRYKKFKMAAHSNKNQADFLKRVASGSYGDEASSDTDLWNYKGENL